MTREEAIEFGKMWLQINEDCKDSSTYAFFQMAIKALEQETVSKESYDHEYFLRKEFEIKIDKLQRQLKALEQEPREGHWIETAEEYYKAINEKGGGVNEDTDYFTDDIACSECLAKFSVIENEAERFDFCPNCGAKMGSEKE